MANWSASTGYQRLPPVTMGYRLGLDPALMELQEPLHDLLRLHYRFRFDPHGLGPADRDNLRRGASACLAGLGRRGPE